MPERDFPVGHPAASDYAGEPYEPPLAPFSVDFPKGHPARGGANIDPLSTCDGMRREVLKQHAANVARTDQALKAQAIADQSAAEKA